MADRDDDHAQRDAEALARVISKYGGVASPPIIRWSEEGSLVAEEFTAQEGQVVKVFCPPEPPSLRALDAEADYAAALAPLTDNIVRFQCRKLKIELRVIVHTHYEPATNTLCIHYRDVTHGFNVWFKEGEEQP